MAITQAMRQLLDEGDALRLRNNYFAGAAADLVVLSFLVDRLGVSVDDIAARFDGVRATMGGDCLAEGVTLRVDHMIERLRWVYEQQSPPSPAGPKLQIVAGGRDGAAAATEGEKTNTRRDDARAMQGWV